MRCAHFPVHRAVLEGKRAVHYLRELSEYVALILSQTRNEGELSTPIPFSGAAISSSATIHPAADARDLVPQSATASSLDFKGLLRPLALTLLLSVS
jgi:hypothetical protein